MYENLNFFCFSAQASFTLFNFLKRNEPRLIRGLNTGLSSDCLFKSGLPMNFLAMTGELLMLLLLFLLRVGDIREFKMLGFSVNVSELTESMSSFIWLSVFLWVGLAVCLLRCLPIGGVHLSVNFLNILLFLFFETSSGMAASFPTDEISRSDVVKDLLYSWSLVLDLLRLKDRERPLASSFCGNGQSGQSIWTTCYHV